jgi:hypothetical protein
MPQITNKIKLSGLFTAFLVSSMLFISCGKEKQAEESETVPVDSTEMQMVPDSLPTDSLPALDDSASTRPEPRKT